MRKKLPEKPCENPDCREMFEPLAPNQRTCKRPRCIRWKARENRKAYMARKGNVPPQPEAVCMPSWGDGCAVGSILWCPFPGITNW